MSSVITIVCILASLLFPTLLITITYPLNKKWARFWSDYISHVCAQHLFAILHVYKHFQFIGDYESKKLLPSKYIVISNHQSLLDIPAYFKFMCENEMKFVAKDTLASTPMVGPMLKCQQHCMIPRKGGMTIAMNRLQNFGRQILENKKQMPVIFPEGTRSKDGNLGTFYSAGFRRLEECVKLPVAVCAIDGGWKISNLDEVIRNLYKGMYRVKVLKVFPAPQNKEEEKAMLDEAHVLIQKQLDEWRA